MGEDTKEAVLERLLRSRISDLEGVLRYLKAQAVNGTLHPQVVIQNADMALRGFKAHCPSGACDAQRTEERE